MADLAFQAAVPGGLKTLKYVPFTQDTYSMLCFREVIEQREERERKEK
jgi:hypothetical protein